MVSFIYINDCSLPLFALSIFSVFGPKPFSSAEGPKSLEAKRDDMNKTAHQESFGADALDEFPVEAEMEGGVVCIVNK